MPALHFGQVGVGWAIDVIFSGRISDVVSNAYPQNYRRAR
jgi:hypothetical protein